MSQIITVGLDLAKNVFQAHGANASGYMVLRKKLRRKPPMLVRVALANKMARIVCALMVRGDVELCEILGYAARSSGAIFGAVRVDTVGEYRGGEHALDRVASAQVIPVHGRNVVKNEQGLPVLDQKITDFSYLTPYFSAKLWGRPGS